MRRSFDGHVRTNVSGESPVSRARSRADRRALPFIFATALLAVGVLSACTVAPDGGDDELGIDTSAVTRIRDADKSVEITWTCFSNRPDVSGLNSQEEYCEWTRRSRPVDGKLQCDFTTGFDATRPFFLTQNETNSQFPETFANSQQFLVGGVEPTGQVREGIVPSCVSRAGQCVSPGCVCGRKSDPQICAVLGTFARNGCTAEAVASPQPTAAPPRGNQEPHPLVAVQLQIPRSLASNCFYRNQRTTAGVDVVVPGVDPATERTYVRCFFDKGQMPNIRKCDDVAKSLTAGARVRVTNPAACNFANVRRDLDGMTPDACK